MRATRTLALGSRTECRIPKQGVEGGAEEDGAASGGAEDGDLLDEMWCVEFGREYPYWDVVA